MSTEAFERWECFPDKSYYDKWAVRDSNSSCKFESSIHVGTKEEAEFLVKRLNAHTHIAEKLGSELQKLSDEMNGLVSNIQQFTNELEEEGFGEVLEFCSEAGDKHAEILSTIKQKLGV